MQVRILGCSGGIGPGLRTTSMLVDDDVAIDFGTGIGDLHREELERIRHVFLSHAHLDHIASLPMVLDTLFEHLLEQPLQVYALPATIEALRTHVFNDVIWPDFTRLPHADKPVVRFVEIAPGDVIELGARRLRVVDVHHAVPTVGFCVANGRSVFAFSGDTTTNDSLWPVLNAYDDLDVLVIEVSFPDRQAELAAHAGHYCPATMVRDLRQLRHRPDIWVTAMKPGEEEQIFSEVVAALPDHNVGRLQSGIVLQL